MSKVYLAYAPADRAIAERLIELLRERGIEVSCIDNAPTGVDFAAWIEASIRESNNVLVLWSDASANLAWLRPEVALARSLGKLIPVTLGVATPAAFSRIQALDLSRWSGDANDPRFDSLIRALTRDTPIGAAPANEPLAHRPPPEIDPLEATLGRSVPSPAQRPPPSQSSGGLLGGAVERFREMFGARKPESDDPFDVSTSGFRSDRARAAMLEPVWLGASAPRQCTRGQRFTAALVAYIAAARESANEMLSALGEPGNRKIMDVPPQQNAGWRIGAPIVVRLIGEGVDVTPPEISFEWNGRENLAAFAAYIRDDAPESTSLAFEVFVAGVPVAFIPMHLTVATRPVPLIAREEQAELPHTVFASYSSKDAQPVTQRLSTLLRWSPGLDIFQDCLDLQPNKSFQPQIQKEISQRDVFLLFWSRNAAASQWVQWEYQTARDTRGLDAILPMPLEDPAIAPPPAELSDRHFRDRFMLAGYGLAKICDEATRPPT